MARKRFSGGVSECFFPTREIISESDLECFGLVLIGEDLGLVQGFFIILTSFIIELAESGERVHRPPLGRLGVHEETMRTRLRFSLHPFIKELMRKYALNPS